MLPSNPPLQASLVLAGKIYDIENINIYFWSKFSFCIQAQHNKLELSFTG